MTTPYHHVDKPPLVQPGANGVGSRALWHGFTKIHRRCRDCKKTCKQSPKVLLIKCPQFEAKDAKD